VSLDHFSALRPPILTEGFCGFPQSLQSYGGVLFIGYNNCFVPYSSQVIIETKPYHLLQALF
jgi:hypothetical protein